MNISYLTEQSILIITEYYKNNLTPYFESVDDDILWIGPAKGQWIRGRQALLDAWDKEKHDLSFSMSSITSNYITSSKHYCEIVLTYAVFIHYPDGQVVHRDQQLHYTWCERKIPDAEGNIQKVPKILMIHISNPISYDERDTIYPVHFPETSFLKARPAIAGSRILVQGLDQATHYLLSDSIVWMESENKGLHTKIHTTGETLSVINSLSSIAKAYPQLFIRTHSSYLVNPMYSHHLKRFQIELSDGAVLPVPQKKYTAVKKAFEEWMENWNKRNI